VARRKVKEITTTEFEEGAAPVAPFSSGEPVTPSASRDFWAYMDEVLSKRDWASTGLKAYVYRKSSEASKLGRPGYLARFERPFDQEDIRKLPGFVEGEYYCIVKQGSDRIYSSPPFDIFGPPNPWPVAAGASTGDGAAAMAQLVKPLVDNQADIKGAMTNALDMQNTAFKSTLAAVSEARTAPVDNSLERAAELFSKLGLIRAGDGDGGGDTFSRMVDTFDKLGLLAKRQSLADEINDVLALTERLGVGGGRRGGSDWAGIVRELGPKLLETGSKVVADLRRINELRAAAGAVRVPPAAAPVRVSRGNPNIPGPGAAGFPSGLDGEPLAPAPAPAAVDRAPAAGAAASPAEPLMTAWDWLRHSARRLISTGGGPHELFGLLYGAAPDFVDDYLVKMSLADLERFIDSDAILSQARFDKQEGGRLSFLSTFHALIQETDDDEGAGAPSAEAEPDEGGGALVGAAASGGIV
jgi:hypothetical protein